MSERELNRLVAARQKAFGEPEEQYQFIVTAEANKQFRVYVNAPGVKGRKMGEDKGR